MKTLSQAIAEGYRVARNADGWVWWNMYHQPALLRGKRVTNVSEAFPTELEAIAALREHLDKLEAK